MGRRSYFISVLSLSALLICFSDSKDFYHEVKCYNDDLNLNCGQHSFIAIHQAYFTSQQTNQTCHSLEHEYIEDEGPSEPVNRTYCFEDVRVILNRRCSGLQSCNFTYSEDTQKLCSNTEGVLIVHYDCVRSGNVNKYCNAKITASEGYIMQPGYPKYYPPFEECSWSLWAAEGQTIFVKILHIHLSPATEVTPTVGEHEPLYALGIGQLTEPVTQCDKDSLSVLEGNVKSFSVCGEDLESLKTFEADASNDLVIKFKSSHFSPASGFLAYFKIKGCPDMPAGEDSHLVERNATAAVYACRDDMVFNDTLENTRFLYCIRNHHWSNTLSPCIHGIDESSSSNSIPYTTTIEQQLENTTTLSLNETVIDKPEPRFTEDVLIPSIIIAILIAGNSIIILIIFILRKRREKKREGCVEEVEDIAQPSTSNPKP